MEKIKEYRTWLVWTYLCRGPLRYWKKSRRPQLILLKLVAKKTDLSYNCVRVIINQLVASGRLKRYRAWDNLNHRRVFFRRLK